MRQTHRLFLMLVASTVMVAGMAIPALAGPEGTLVGKINSSRAASGLAPLDTYWDLTDDARAHSSRMSDRGEIYHNRSLSSVTSVWMKLGENVGMGVDIGSLHNAFMNSSSHRANVLGDYNYVGVGVKADDAGVLWVTVVFMKAADGLNGGTTTTTTQPPATTTTTTQPPPTTTTTQPPAPATTKAPSVVRASQHAPAQPAVDVPVRSAGVGHRLIFWI
ncbi:MAG: CAP domain-containing protein [Actinomycetota bacterium]|nr:CAP domain-containing protein [Actinomycetota bacterium]MDK1292224.1 CAP domain-containing protein [Actinomycetota bacterium]